MTDANPNAAGAPAVNSPAASPATAGNTSVQRAPQSKETVRSPLITNPAPEAEKAAEAAPSHLPESTIAEMEAGKKALERHKPQAVPASAKAEDKA